MPVSSPVRWIAYCKSPNHVNLLHASGTMTQQPSNEPECLRALLQVRRISHGPHVNNNEDVAEPTSNAWISRSETGVESLAATE